MSRLRRPGAVLAGVALLAAWVEATLLVLLVGSYGLEEPNPFISDGDPCCGHPDTWGQVALGALALVVGAVLTSPLLVGAVTTLLRGVRGRWPSRRRLVLIPMLAGGAAVLAVLVAFVLQRGSAVSAACDDDRMSSAPCARDVVPPGG